MGSVLDGLIAPVSAALRPERASAVNGSTTPCAPRGYAVGDADRRPWGTWSVVATGKGHAVKTITVDPGERLSSQYHRHRSEHWVVVCGVAVVEIDDDKRSVGAGEHVYIPRGAVHRITNPGSCPLIFVEVQCGQLLDENDIVRLSDDYGRG